MSCDVQVRRSAVIPWLVLVALLTGAASHAMSRTAQDTASRRLWQDGAVTLSIRQAPLESGLIGSRLRIERSGVVREVPLDGTATGRRARQVDAAYVLPGGRRAVLHVDRVHDPGGLIVVDLENATVVDALIGRELTMSPDGRFWMFEEYATPHLDVWPHTETVYALYDAAAPAEANRRLCAAQDDRCRGQVVFLPDRLEICQAIAVERAGVCTDPGREPRHARRSPFVWLSSREVAWVDVDRARQAATMVVATIGGDGRARVQAVPIDHEHVIDAEEVPSVRETWTIERITRDADVSRVWLHFRNRMPQVPAQRLGVRLQ